MHLAPACSFWLLLGVAFYEWPRMAQANALGLIYAKPLLYLAAAAMGFGVNSLAYIVIQLASSLTLKVLLRRSCSLCKIVSQLVMLYLATVRSVRFDAHGLAYIRIQLASSVTL